MGTLGLIAGNRTFHLQVARAARLLGYRVVAVGLKEETDPALEGEVDAMHWVSLSEVGDVPGILRREGAEELILAGQIKPEWLLQGEDRFDGVVQQLFRLIPDRSGLSAMKMAVRYLESQGFNVLHSGTFLKEWVPGAGVLTRRAPSTEEQEEIRFGLPIGRQAARLGIGQTLVVRRRAVVAVEAIEGTDAAIRRAGQIAGPGCVVIKALEPDHDMRFDIPVVGVDTLRAMREAGAACLAVEAGRTLLFDLPEVVREADGAGIAIAAV